MAVVTVKALAISNRDSVPAVLSMSNITRAPIKQTVGYAAVANGDSIGSKYILANVPSNARLSQMAIFCSAITSAAADIGLYSTTANGGAAVSAQFFKAAQSLAAALTGTDLTYANVMTLDLAEQEIWQVLGLASDPALTYDVAAVLTAAATAAGKLVAKVAYSE